MVMQDNKGSTGFKFQPTISFDGVAIIIACIFVAVAWGRLSAVVEQNTKDVITLRAQSDRHQDEINDLKVKIK